MALSGADAIRLVKEFGSINKGAAASGMPRTNFKTIYAKAIASKPDAEPEIEFPLLPESELPVEKIIDHACENFAAAHKAREARRWMEIKIKRTEPIGLCLMGDPHIDNAGTNWPLLREHVK